MVPIVIMKTRCMDGFGWLMARVMALVVMGGIGGGCAKEMSSTTANGTGGSVGTGGGGGVRAGSGGNSAGTGGATLANDDAATDAPTDGGTDGRPAEPLGIFTAADDLQGFALNTFSNPDNLGDPTRDGGVMATLTWDGTEGTPDKGALKVVASYSAFTQFVIVQHDFSDLDVRDWTGRKLHLWLKIATGNTGARPVKVFVQDQIAGTDGGVTTYPYADQYQTALPGSDWQEFTFDETSATYKSADWDPLSIKQVRLFGVNVAAGTAADADSGVTPAAATVFIDNIWLE